MMSAPDPIMLAILSQAVTFLFGQAGKLMEERRISRQKRGEKDEAKSSSRPIKIKTSHKAVTASEELTSLQPQVLQLRDIPEEIEHYLGQIHQYRENKRSLEAQVAAYGGFIHSPLIVQNQIKNAEQEIYDNCQNLKHLVEEVYDREIIINGLD